MKNTREKVLGIICARKGSKRLKNKNFLKIEDVSIFERAVRTLSESNIDHLVIAADLKPNFDPSTYDAVFIERSVNISRDNVPLQETIMWIYYSLDREFEYLVFIMPNCPMIDSSSINKAINLALSKNLNVVRSYNSVGMENGIIVVRTDYLKDHFIDVYCGSVIADGDEIHNEQDYIKTKQIIEGKNDI